MEKFKHVGLMLLLSLCILLSALLSRSFAAEQAIGKIIAIRGQATALGADTRALKMASEIYLGEVVRTAERCRLQMLFTDNTIVSLGPSSEFLVKDYAWDAETRQGKMNSRVNEGVFRVLGGSITKSSPKNFTTETPSATIGIRGSMYAGKVRAGKLDVVFQGGKGIYIRNSLGSVDISTPGYGIKQARIDIPPREPQPFSPAELEALDPLRAVAPQQQTTVPVAERVAVAKPKNSTEADKVTSQPEPTDPTVAVAEPMQPAETGKLAETLEIVDPPAQEQPKINPPAPAAPPAPVVTAFSGRYQAVQDDLVANSNIADQTWLGAFNGSTSAGVLTSSANTNNGLVVVQPLNVIAYDPSLPYTGFSKTPIASYTTDLLGTSTSFTSAELLMDNAGEFAVISLRDNFNLPTYQYSLLGFLGAYSSSVPASGISHYTGLTNGTLDNLGPVEFETIGHRVEMSVNWHNGKLLGGILVPDGMGGDQPVGFFIGDVSGTSFTTSLFFGNDISDLGPGPILAISGSSSFGEFYGSKYQGVGFEFSGNTHSVEFQTLEENWQLSGAGFRAVNNAASTVGSVTWQGFAIGVGEDMGAIDSNRRLFVSQLPSDFSLSINQDAGSINGSLTARDVVDPSVAINALQIGGSNPSAYIDDQLFAAGVGGGSPIMVSASTGGLKAQGNYLITEDPSKQLASYASWGIWEIAYSDPVSSGNYHVHVPGSLWVAGELTSTADFAALNFPATYTGTAEGVYVPVSGQYLNMPSGTFSLDVDFGTGTLTSGAINFPAGNGAPAVNLGIDPTSVSASGFSAVTSSPTFGTVNGAFYGPNAKSVAGNFEAQLVSDRVIGVFGGDRP